MDELGQLFLAQTVNTMADLKNAVGHGLGIVVILGYVYAVIMIIMALISERGDGKLEVLSRQRDRIIRCKRRVQHFASDLFPRSKSGH